MLMQSPWTSQQNVLNYIRSPDLSNKQIVHWHDLIRNIITSHRFNNYKPRSVNQLLLSLQILPNLYDIVYCQCEGTDNIFDRWRTLDTTVFDNTNDILSKSEQQKETLIEKYRKLLQSPSLELRTLGVVLHYYSNPQKKFTKRGTKRRSHGERRQSKKRKLDDK